MRKGVKLLILSFKIIALQLVFLFGIANSANAQDVKKETETKTKLDLLFSEPGVIIKTVDYKMASLPTMTLTSNAETKVRVCKSERVEEYYYIIKIVGKNGTMTAAIEHSDLLKVIDALKTLKAEEKADISSKPDYLENKYITSDGFKVGYIIKNGWYEKGTSTWYLSQGSHCDLGEGMVLRSVEDFEQAIEEAKQKMDELKTISGME